MRFGTVRECGEGTRTPLVEVSGMSEKLKSQQRDFLKVLTRAILFLEFCNNRQIAIKVSLDHGHLLLM